MKHTQQQHTQQRIASFDVGIRTFNFCIVNHCVVNHKYITERILKGIQRLTVLKENSTVDHTIKRNLIYELNELCRTVHLISVMGERTVEIEQWTLDDLFPIEKHNCTVCSKSAKWKSKSEAYCTRHRTQCSTGTVEIKKRNITTIPIAEICKATVLKLREHPELLQCDAIVIEKQAGKFSARIGRVESYLYSYFMDHGVCNPESKIERVAIVHAKGKLKVLTPVSIDSSTVGSTATNRKGIEYRKRKSASVQIVVDRLERERDYNRLDYLNSVGAKRDDLCDNYLQALYVLGY